jgi:hypothetical protein
MMLFSILDVDTGLIRTVLRCSEVCAGNIFRIEL